MSWWNKLELPFHYLGVVVWGAPDFLNLRKGHFFLFVFVCIYTYIYNVCHSF